MEKIIEVQVKVDSKEQKINQISDNLFEIWLKSSAKKGKANKELLKLLSTFFNIHSSQIQILQGNKSRTKIIKITI